MNLLRAWLAGLPAYLWSGWGAIASLCLLLAAWEAVSLAYGPLVMPDPRAAFATLWGLIDSGAAWPELAATARRALTGYALSVVAGSVRSRSAQTPAPPRRPPARPVLRDPAAHRRGGLPQRSDRCQPA